MSLNSFFEKIIEESKKNKAFPIEKEEFEFIFENFKGYLKGKNKEKLKILEIGGGIGSFTLRFSFKLAKEGFYVEYCFIEKDKEKINLFNQFFKVFKEKIGEEM
jgi:predicted O-methyltransferase YrrM